MPDIPGNLRNAILNVDARDLADQLPDASIDLVFTDPVYDQLDDYFWLAKTAARVLKPDRNLLAWASVPKAARVQGMMEISPLDYVYTLTYTVKAKTYRMRGYHLFCWTTPCLWFRKGAGFMPDPWVPDTFISSKRPDGAHKWNKNQAVLGAWLKAYCPPGGTVWDPFCGGGSIPVMCKMLGLTYVASEIDPDTTAMAIDRLANTLPLFEMIQGQF